MNNDTCSICLLPFAPEAPAETLCGHKFHYPCIAAWERRRPNCPLCRYESGFTTELIEGRPVLVEVGDAPVEGAYIPDPAYEGFGNMVQIIYYDSEFDYDEAVMSASDEDYVDPEEGSRDFPIDLTY